MRDCTSLISLTAIPLSLIAAALVLYFTGATINTMVIAGLAVALGDNVDDSVIDVENILRRLRQARTDGREHSLTGVIRDASVEIRNPIIFSTLIDVIAIAPIFLLSGLVAAFFQPLVLSYAICIVASMVISLTIDATMQMA